MKYRAAGVVAGLAATVLLASAGASNAQISVDGTRDAAYGSAKARVTYDAAAPRDNFGTPGPTTNGQAYDIYLTSDANYLYGFIQGLASGTSAGNFANLYFDLDPQNGNGSDLGFEITNDRAFIPGQPGYAGNLSGLDFSTSVTGGGVEFRISNAYFTSAISGLSYAPNQTFASVGSNVTLRLSQSLGYSVAGGDSYGANRLGSVVIGGTPAVSAVPEPAAWALMLSGVGFLGLMLRTIRRRRRGQQPLVAA